MENGSPHAASVDAVDAASLAHKRSLSGPGGILSRLPFLRSPSTFEDHDNTIIGKNGGLGIKLSPPQQEHSRPAMPSGGKAQRARKRKESLRKTALLGTGKLKSSTLDAHKELASSTTTSQPRIACDSGPQNQTSLNAPTSSEGAVNQPSKLEDERVLEDPKPVDSGVWASLQDAATNELKLDTRKDNDECHISPTPTVTSSITSPRYTSTTDDDDGPTFSATTAANNELIRRKSSRNGHTKSAGQPHPPPAPPLTASPPDHDYSSTASWGWFILVITWIVFVVGMGSCLGVWSWAWDVGETPYAPPELEDDPTLPIVGYYPALIVMTGVMAWVWVVVAWVGMKYFRHARYGEE